MGDRIGLVAQELEIGFGEERLANPLRHLFHIAKEYPGRRSGNAAIQPNIEPAYLGMILARPALAGLAAKFCL